MRIDSPSWTTTAITALLSVGVSVALSWRWQQQSQKQDSATNKDASTKRDEDSSTSGNTESTVEDTPELVASDEPKKNPAIRVTDKTIYGNDGTTKFPDAAVQSCEDDNNSNSHESKNKPNIEILAEEDLQRASFSAKDIPDFTMVLDDDEDDGDMF